MQAGGAPLYENGAITKPAQTSASWVIRLATIVLVGLVLT